MTINKANRDKIFLISILLIFLLSFCGSSYFALNTSDKIYPDEGHHMALSKEYEGTLSLIKDTPELYHFGQVSRQPFLYHWSMGRVLNANSGHMDELLLLRMVSVVINMLTLFVYYLISKEFTKSRLVQLLSLFIITNSLMYVFMSGAVNYDTFNLLFSALAIYFFILFIKYKNVDHLLLITIISTIGALNKVSFLPLAVVLFSLLIIDIARNYNRIKVQFRTISWSRLIMYLTCIAAIVVALQFYGHNIWYYRQIVPDCDRVLTVEKCMTSLQYKRDFVLIAQNAGTDRLDPIHYAASWFSKMVDSTFGIYAFMALSRSFVSTIPYLLLGLVGIVALMKRANFKDTLLVYLLSVFLFYLSFLFIYVNYRTYLENGIVAIAVNARYLFPVYFIFILMMIRSIFSFIKSGLLRSVLTLVIVIWFIYGGYGFYHRYATADWVKQCNFILELRNCTM